MNFQTAIAAFLLVIFSASTSAVYAQDDAISSIFSKYVDDEESTVVYISGKMFDLMESVVKNLDTEDMNAEQVKALTDVVQDMRSLRIVSRPGDRGVVEYKAAKAKMLSTKSYELLMTVRERGNTYVDFFVRERDGLVDELLLLVAESPEGVAAKAIADDADDDDFTFGLQRGSFTLLSFEGRIDLNRVGELAKAFEDGDIKIGDK